MSVFTWVPDYNANQAKKPRKLSAKFGDGYIQDVGDGINSNPKIWQVTFTVAPSVADAIDAFLDTCNGITPFDWTPPRAGASSKFICEEWSKAENAYGEVVVTAKFEQRFG